MIEKAHLRCCQRARLRAHRVLLNEPWNMPTDARRSAPGRRGRPPAEARRRTWAASVAQAQHGLKNWRRPSLVPIKAACPYFKEGPSKCFQSALGRPQGTPPIRSRRRWRRDRHPRTGRRRRRAAAYAANASGAYRCRLAPASPRAMHQSVSS
jgi:hypothetical protein